MSMPSLLLIHGAACGAWVWDAWRRHLQEHGWQVNVLDLRGHGRSLPTDFSTVTMEDYVADLASVTPQIEAAQGVHPVLGGWSMGGLVAMMYAAEHPETPATLLFDPMVPAEVRKADIETLRRFAGTSLTPAAFGIHPDDRELSRRVLFDLTDAELDEYLARTSTQQESGLAFRQALRGISVPSGSIACPALVLSPDADPDSADVNQRLARHLNGDVLSVPGAGHWGMVWHEQAVAQMAPKVDAWLRASVAV